MRSWQLVIRSLRYYWRINLVVVGGVGIAIAVLAGALMVGESVRASLRRLALDRIGSTVTVVRADAMFREEPALEIAPSAPMMAAEGLVRRQTSGTQATQVAVYGVDDRFWRFHQRAPVALEGREAAISPALAEELGAKEGDTLLVRIDRRAEIPADSLFGRKEEASQAIRVRLKRVLSPGQLGEFSLVPKQGEVKAAFIPLKLLQEQTGAGERVNVILSSEPLVRVIEGIRQTAQLEDLGIRVRAMAEAGELQMETSSGILADELAEAALKSAVSADLAATPALTYLATTLRVGDREAPYSLVAAVDLTALGGKGKFDQDAIVLNEWAARDLRAKAGDPLLMDYMLWHDDGRITTEKAAFTVAGVTPIRGLAADRNLAPEYPGITDSENVSDWDPPFPLDLSRVRPVDEDYWKQYRTTPKAWVTLARGQQLWRSRFGKLTTIRLRPAKHVPLESAEYEFRRHLRTRVDPMRAGIAALPLREQALEASRGATDFGEYFLYFSFFLMASALLLAGLFFRLGVEQRASQIGLLEAVGFQPARITWLYGIEALLLALAGGAVGLPLAAGYAGLILTGLGSWWVDAVGTKQLGLEVSSGALLLGLAAGIVASLAATLTTLRMLRRLSAKQLLSGESAPVSTPVKWGGYRIAIVSAVLAAGLVVAGIMGWVADAGAFFGAGALLLAAALSLLRGSLGGSGKFGLAGAGASAMLRLMYRNTAWRPGRTVLSAALIGSATFLIVSLESFRRPPDAGSMDVKSGTGGYALMGESVRPLHHNPNTEEGRMRLNLDMAAGARFEGFRLRPGDDASCLNLYQPQNPRILGAPEAFLQQGRFSFAGSLAQTEAEKRNPWLLLEGMENGAIPAAADANSMAYVLHKKLGEEIEITTSRGKLRLKLVAALRDSVFQSELIIDERAFLRAFPGQQGFRVFLIETPRGKEKQLAEVIENALADQGFDAISTAAKLEAFHRVENTYLSTFQSLGAMGLLLGTLGLAAVLIRNVMERRRELALLAAVGYSRNRLGWLILGENLLLLGSGLAAGAAAAALAIAPVVVSRGFQASTASLAAMLAVVALTGIAATGTATYSALRMKLVEGLRAG